MAMIIGCKPEITSANGDEITLRIPGGEEGMSSFKEAIRVAGLSQAEFDAEYDQKHCVDRRKAYSDD